MSTKNYNVQQRLSEIKTSDESQTLVEIWREILRRKNGNKRN